MAKVIDELLIAIGFESDDKGAREVASTMDNIKSMALQMGGALAGAFSFKSLTSDFAAANDQLGKFTDYMKADVSLVYDLGRAIEHNGGQAEDAFAMVNKLADLQDSLVTGQGLGWMEDVSRASEGLFDVSVIKRGMSFGQMLDAVAGQMGNLNAEQRRRTSQAIGFDMGAAQTLQSSEYLNQQLKAVQQFGTVTKDMTAVAANYNDAAQDLRDAALDVRNELSLALLPSLVDTMREVSGFYAENRDAFQSAIEEITPYLETTAKAVTALVAIQVGKKGISMIASGAPTAAAVIGGTWLIDEYEKKERGEFNIFDEMGQRWDVQKDDIAESLGIRKPKPVTGDAGMTITNDVPSSSTVVNHNNVTINASGMTENQVKNIVSGVLSGAATQTEQDLKVNSQ